MKILFRSKILRILLIIEIILAALAVILDVFIPTLVILALAAFSIIFNAESLRTLGFTRIHQPLRTVGKIFLLVIIWSLVLLALVMPALNHLLGTTQDLSAFEDLKGNFGKLILLLTLSWTLAAFGEEIAYRGYLQQRLYRLLGRDKLTIPITIFFTSILFGIAHSEQGMIGVIITTLDAIILSIVKEKFDGNLWAPILFHGINNTIGIITFFFFGPIYGFW
jgi:uncharacterized protein